MKRLLNMIKGLILYVYYKIKIGIVIALWGNEGLIWLVQHVISNRVRTQLLIKYGAEIAPSALIRRGLYLHNAKGKKPFRHLKVQENVFIDRFVMLDLSNSITIAKHAALSCGVKIYTHFGSPERKWNFHKNESASVTIGEYSRIQPNVFVSCGTEIRDNVIVGACSFVKAFSVLESNSLYAGVPARHLKTFSTVVD